MFSLLVKVLYAMETRKEASLTIPTIRYQIEQKINSSEYQQSKISSTGLRRHLDSAESLGLIKQFKSAIGEACVILTKKAKVLLATSNGSSKLENFHLRNLKFPFDPLDLTRLSSEELLLCQFRADISTDIEDRVVELYWKRRASFLEDGSSWSEGVKLSQTKRELSPPPTPPTSSGHRSINILFQLNRSILSHLLFRPDLMLLKGNLSILLHHQFQLHVKIRSY